MAGTGGSRQAPDGLPAGFPHTPDGAAAAATVDLNVVTDSAMFAPDSRAAGWTTISDPTWWSAHQPAVTAYYAGQANQLGLNAPGAAPAGTSLVVTVHPEWGAFKLARYTRGTAWVVIWYYDQSGLSGANAKPQWLRTELTLHWVAAVNDWRLASIPATTAGPTPTPAASVPTAATRAALLGDTSGWHLYATASHQ